MASFGSYETNREISSASGAEVFSARKSGESSGPEYAVKLYSLEGLIGDDPQTRSDLDSVLLELSRSFSSRIEIQQKAAQVSARVAPVFESGRDARGAWYVTQLYPRTLQKIVAGNVALRKEGIGRVARCVTEGALALKKSAGRSHGNLKLSNVLLGGAARIRHAEVVLSDPLPGDAGEAPRYELADLREIGRIIYQLVLRREIINADDWMLLLPLASSKEWTATFDKKAERWIKLCNRLLDPNLAPETFHLEDLLRELVSLEPKPPISGKKLALVAGLACLCGVAVVLILHRTPHGLLEISVDPTNATILLDGEIKRPGQETVSVGAHTLVGRYPGLKDYTTQIAVLKNETARVALKLDYVRAVVSSTPPGASVKVDIEADGKVVTINLPESGQAILPPKAGVQMTFQLKGYMEYDTNLTLNGSIGSIAVHALLEEKKPLPPGLCSVTFTNLLRGATVTISDSHHGLQATRISASTWPTNMLPGQYQLSASYPNLLPVSFPFEVKQDTKDTNIGVGFEYAVVSFSCDSGDVGEVSIEGARWKETNPFSLIWRAGQVRFNFHKPGFEPATVELNLTKGQRANVLAPYKRAVGYAVATSDPDGARVVDSGGSNIPLSARMALKPDAAYEWRADYAGLDAITKRFTVKLGATTSVPFQFSYGTLDLSVEPADAAVSETGHVLKSPYHFYLRPGQRHVYSIASPGYDSTNVAISLKTGQFMPLRMALLRPMVSVRFITDPPGGKVFDPKHKLIPDQGINLRGGEYPFSATYPGLEPISTKILVSNDTFHLRFNYGTLVCTSSIPGAQVFQERKLLGVTPTNLFLPPSSETSYTLVLGNQTKTLRASVVRGLTAFLGAVFTNGDVMTMPLDGSTLSGSNDLSLKKLGSYWVGQYDVTQGQYERVIGTNPSFFNKERLGANWNPRLPVESVNLDDAMNFCQLLNERTSKWLFANNLRGYKFALPSEDEWKAFLGDGKDASLVYANKPAPQEVGRQGHNTNDIHDAWGNVCQWLSNGYVAGCSFKDRTRFIIGGVRPGNNVRDSAFGFRVVLKPSPSL